MMSCKDGYLCCTERYCQETNLNRLLGRQLKTALKCYDWMNWKTCKFWLECRNTPPLLPPLSLCLVTKLSWPGQSFCESHQPEQRPYYCNPAPPPPCPFLHLLAPPTLLSCPPLMRWWVYFFCFPPLACVHPLIHWLQEVFRGSPVMPYIPLPWQQSWTKAASQYNTGVLSFIGFMDWY